MSKPERVTKLDIVNSALGKIAISGITAPAMGDDYARVLDRLEGMMYEFEQARNICCNYRFTESPDGSDPHGMALGLVEPVSNILVIRVLSDYGITPRETMLAAASAGISSLHAQTFRARETQYPRRQPRGSGNTLRYNRWQRFYRKPYRVPVSCDTIRISGGEINDYTESFISYLLPGEDIEHYEIMATQGVALVSARQSPGIIHYRLEGMDPTVTPDTGQVRVRVTTTDGRVEERTVNVQVLPATDDSRFNNSLAPEVEDYG